MDNVLILDRYDMTLDDNVEYNADLGTYSIFITFDSLSNAEFVDISSHLEENPVFYISQIKFVATSWRVVNLTLCIDAIPADQGPLSTIEQRRVM